MAEFHNLRGELAGRVGIAGYDNAQHYWDRVLYHFGWDKSAEDFAFIVKLFKDQ